MKHIKKSKIAIMILSGGCILAMSAGIAACGKSGTPVVENGESTTLVTKKLPEKLTPDEVIYAFLQKQSELQSYVITAEGTAVASLAGYKQNIHNITYRNGEDFLNQASSNSSLVNMKHQSFSKGGKVVYRNSYDGEMKVAEKAEYKKIYGFTADEVTLGGFIINPKTLRYSELESTTGDTLTYHYRLAGDQSVENGSATESATALIRYQAKAYGSLGNLPAYSDVDLRLTVKNDWTPVSYTSSCSYTAKKILNMSVEERITSVYSKVNDEVEIPSVEEFNQKLGTTPSTPVPPQEEEDPLMQLMGAVGDTLGEENAAELPVSLDLGLSDATKNLTGDLQLKLRREALEKGDFADAISARFDLDLAKIPLISGIANTLTVRYPGDGVLLLMLNNKVDGKDNYLFTYTADLGEKLSSLAGEDSLEALRETLESSIGVEKTDAGYTLTLTEETVGKLNTAYEGFLTSFAEKMGDTNGYIRSLLGFTFTELKLELAGIDKTTGVSISVAANPSENVTLGEKIAVSLETKLFGGAFQRPFAGDLEIRLNLAAIWAGDYFAAAKAHLRLDLTPAAPLLQMLGMFGSMIPDLPSFISAELSSLDLYYTGDGMLTLAFNNAQGLPMGTTEVNLKETIANSGTTDPGTTDPGTTEQTFSLLPFTLTVSANGVKLALGEPAVQAIAAAYNGLIDSLVQKMTEGLDPGMAGMAKIVFGGWLGGEITGVEVFLGTTDEKKVTFDLTIYGKPGRDPNGDYSERVFLDLTITDKAPLTAAESADLVSDKAVKALKDTSAKATEYAEKLQELIDGMDVSEAGYTQYVEKVTALQNEIDGLDPAVKTLMSNNSYLAEKTVGDKTYTVLLLTAELYHNRAEQFKSTVKTIKADSPDTEWDALNALYDKAATVSDIQVPAVKESKVLKTAIGEDTIANYLAKRAAHESKLARELTEQIAAAKTAFEAEENQTRDGWTQGLTKIVKEFKPVYDKLPDQLKEGTGYQEFVKQVYQKNLEEVTKAYNAVKDEVDALIEKGNASIDDLLGTMKKLSEANAWGFGYDYWVANTDTVIQPWGKTWLTALKPTDLSADDQAKVSELNTLNRSFLKGAIAKEILDSYAELIKTEVETLYNTIKDCRIVADGKADEWDFDGLAGDKNEVLEKLHGLRFLICKVLTTDLFNDTLGWDEAVKQFARNDLTKYEAALGEHLAKQQGAKG